MANSKNVNIFKFDCPHEFLNAIWEEKKRNNPSYSVRAWSSSFGYKNNFLSFLLKKERKFSKKNITKFINNLGLTSGEADYFEALIDCSIQVTEEGRQYYNNKIITLRKLMSLTKETLESFLYLENPLHGLISELVRLKEFKYDIEYIVELLNKKYSKRDIDTSINRLKLLNIIKEENNRLLPTSRAQVFIHGKDNFMMDEASKLYHEKILDTTKEELLNYSTQTAKFSNYIFNIKTGDFQNIEREYNRFIENIIDKYEAKDFEGDRTYYFNHQIFPVSK